MDNRGVLAYFNEAQFVGLNKTAKKQTLTMDIISPDKLSYDAITSLFPIDNLIFFSNNLHSATGSKIFIIPLTITRD